MPVSFAETSFGEMRSIIDINVNATLRVTQVVLRRMLTQYVLAPLTLTLNGMTFTLAYHAHRKRRGLILTLTSFAGAIPSPLLATYSGSKAFLQTWSDALQSELKGTGIDVECVSTYFVVRTTLLIILFFPQ